MTAHLGELHPLQYAFAERLAFDMAHAEPIPVPGREPLRPRHPPVVLGTENLSDDEVLDRLRHDPHLLPSGAHKLDRRAAYGPFGVERYNRCPTCEQWSPCDVRRVGMTGAGPLSVTCPHCQEPPGNRCGTVNAYARKPHVARVRFATAMAAHADPMLDAWPQLGPVTPCRLCGSGLPQRHRIVDAIIERMAAGDDPEDVAGDYGLPMDAVRDLIEWDAKWVTAEWM